MKNLLVFIKSKVFFKHLILSVVSLIVLFFVAKFFIKLYTLHGTSLSTPDLTGMSLEQVAQVCEEKDLQYEVVDSVFNAEVDRGTVVAQTPPPDYKIKKNRTLFLTIRTTEDEKITMPNLVGVSLIQAKADIEMYGLKLGELSYRPDIATNSVLDQMYKGRTITAGTTIKKGAKIDLVLGKGRDKTATSVPNLLQLKYSKAESLLKDMYLNLGATIFDENIVTSQDSLKAFVWKQQPETGKSIQLGDVVDVWLTTDSTKIETK